MVDFQNITEKASPELKSKAALALDSLEYNIYKVAIEESRFSAILNEKIPPNSGVKITVPEPVEGVLVSDEVYAIRRHPDVRIARRAQVLARLTQVINERKASSGLRRTLVTQAKRLQWISEKRFSSFDT